MKIAGLQKLTLLDFPGKTACTVFTWGCNLRCPFCHNAGLVTEAFAETVTADELDAFLKKRGGSLKLIHVNEYILDVFRLVGYTDVVEGCPD